MKYLKKLIDSIFRRVKPQVEERPSKVIIQEVEYKPEKLMVASENIIIKATPAGYGTTIIVDGEELDNVQSITISKIEPGEVTKVNVELIVK